MSARSGSASLADLVQAPRQVGFAESFAPSTLWKIGILAALFTFLNLLQFRWLWTKWIGDPNWSHGFVIPLFSLYLLYSRRAELFAAKRRVCVPGLAIMLLCLVVEFVGIYSIRNYWISQIAMVGVIFGLVLYLGGPAVMRVAWLPIVFLIFALPIPELLYARFSLPLQNIAAKGAVVIVRLLGVDISNNASALHMSSQSGIPRDLTVAEACSGMRLLMAFLALGVATAYLDYKPLWQRVILVGAAIPIAVFCNTLRVSITCWMYYIDKPELGQNFMHYFTGVLMLAPALGMLWVLSWLLKQTLVDVEEDEDSSAPPAGQGGAS